MGNRFREKSIEEGLEAPKVAPEQPSLQSVDGSPAPSSSHPKRSKAVRGLGRILAADILSDRLVLRQIPLLILCLVYVLLLIGNRYKIERLSRDKAATEERINYLREERIHMQEQYQQSAKMSQIAEDLKHTGVGITAGPPYEIER